MCPERKRQLKCLQSVCQVIGDTIRRDCVYGKRVTVFFGLNTLFVIWLQMTSIQIILFALAVTSISCRPKESTHDLLSRLGFDPVHKPGVNYHKKRVAEDSARFGGHSEKDSHMFVVRLPPHHSYYSLQQAEKLENEVLAKPLNVPLNGKPAQIYHWNIPQLKKFAKQKKTHAHDSKIVRLKIKPDEYEFYKKMRKDGKPNVYKLKKEHVMSIKELAEHQNDRPMPESDSKFTHIRKNTDDSSVTVVKFNAHPRNQLTHFEGPKFQEKTPLIYSPAIPKYNSFHKYFPGNGKPKSFYVIEKSENPSRYHRLL